MHGKLFTRLPLPTRRIVDRLISNIPAYDNIAQFFTKETRMRLLVFWGSKEEADFQTPKEVTAHTSVPWLPVTSRAR